MLLKTEHLRIKMYDDQCDVSEPLRYFIPDPAKPHGIMCSIEKTDEGYFCNVKILVLGFSELLESIFCLLLVVEAFSLQKFVEMLEEVVLGWQEVTW